MLLRKLSNPAGQAWLACVLLPINTRLHTANMPTDGSSRRMLYQQCISLRPRNSSCWTSHLLSAVDGLHHAHHFQQKMRSADPLDLSQLVLDLRSRHLAYWRHFLVTTQNTQIAKHLLIITGVLSQPSLHKEKKRKEKLRRKSNSPYNNEGKGDTLAHKEP
eukprot:340200-Pelagomonas_calceolata.AAC.1